MIYLPSPSGTPLRQCEILSDLYVSRLALESVAPGSATQVVPIHHPFAIILSQDCDLDIDYKARFGDSVIEDKLLPSVLFCEVTTADNLRSGNGINSELWRRIVKNNDERYQYLRSITAEQDALTQGLPALGADFKRYFTVPTDEVYEQLKHRAKRRCLMESPYLEHLSNRFCHFQMRVAVLEPH